MSSDKHLQHRARFIMKVLNVSTKESHRGCTAGLSFFFTVARFSVWAQCLSILMFVTRRPALQTDSHKNMWGKLPVRKHLSNYSQTGACIIIYVLFSWFNKRNICNSYIWDNTHLSNKSIFVYNFSHLLNLLQFIAYMHI